MLGSIKKEESRIYLNVKDGAVVRRTDKGDQRFAFVSGAIEKIYTRDRSFRGETVKYWYIDMRDPGGELYSIGFSYRSNVFKGIVLSLATAGTLNDVKIEPYIKNNYEKVVVYQGGIKLDWIVKALPAVEVVNVGGHEVKDDSKRMKYIASLVDGINKRTGTGEIGNFVTK